MFTATVSLTADFETAGTISGSVTNFRGKRGLPLGAWTVDLMSPPFGDDTYRFKGSVGGGVDSRTWDNGSWTGGFFPLDRDPRPFGDHRPVPCGRPRRVSCRHGDAAGERRRCRLHWPGRRLRRPCEERVTPSARSVLDHERSERLPKAMKVHTVTPTRTFTAVVERCPDTRLYVGHVPGISRRMRTRPQVPISHEDRYFFCSRVSLSIWMPMVASFDSGDPFFPRPGGRRRPGVRGCHAVGRPNSEARAWVAKLMSMTEAGWPSAAARFTRRPSPRRNRRLPPGSV